MGSDISRSTFDAKKRYSAVRQQQGRVGLDADWNEQVDIAAYRLGTETVDVIGACGAPSGNAGFQIQQLQGPSLVWAPSTAYAQGSLISDPTGNVQVAITGGTSGVTAPSSWPNTIGATPVSDGISGLAWQFVESNPAANAVLTISPGRIYVDGLLCELKPVPVAIENFTGDGTGTAGTQVQVSSVVVDGFALKVGDWVQISAQGSAAPLPIQISAVNTAAGSLTFAAVVSSFGSPNTNPQLQRLYTCTAQPDYPSAPSLPAAGTSIIYLDVWERTIAALEDPQIQEVALNGADTTTRTKVVWQVKLVDVSSVSGVTCATASDASPWETAIQPSAGQLTNGVVQSAATGPCSLNANTGYTGMENQLYRVEIHQPGTPISGAPTFPAPPGTATFKWSRDNASVATGVTSITSTTSSGGSPASQLTVLSTGRDDVLSFSPGDWIEITDDYLELGGQPGELHQIDTNGVNQTSSTIALQTAVSSALQSRLTGPTNYHARICRWDQSGKVYESDDTTVWIDLDAANSSGDIPVPPAGTTLVLENGITVSFGLNSATGSCNTGDYWNFAARTADGSVDQLNQAPAFGINHHYCRLGIIKFAASPWGIQDCRQVFPPLAESGVHVIGIYLASAGALLNDGTITVQDLSQGITVMCDSPLDPNTITQPNSAPPPPATGAPIQATCFVTVDVPTPIAGSIMGFSPLMLAAGVSLDTTQTTIGWTPTGSAISGLVSQISANTPILLAHLTLKGRFIWAAGNPNVLLDGSAVGAPYQDASGAQHTGLRLPSGNGRPGGDFEMWFWLTSAPTVTVSASNLDFGNQLQGVASAPLSITVSNGGSSPLPVTVALPAGGDFSETDTCGGAAGGTLAAGANCTINVTFTPTALGTRAGAISITAGGQTFTVTLTGTGVAPALSASPSSLNFGLQLSGTTSAPQIVTLTNTGTAPVTITGIASTDTEFTTSYTAPPVLTRPGFGVLSGGLLSIDKAAAPLLVEHALMVKPGDTAIGTGLAGIAGTFAPAGLLFTMAPGAQATISVQFSPAKTGAINATLNISSNLPGSPLPVPLAGTGFVNFIRIPTGIKV
ncbi:MAG TPA: DUF6519 domain-containing protein [Terriglobales bacterium]|jgi:hypothetical protein|nr:DUF6519 domain-containing protein [Terriglobales bacterium]